MAISWNKNLETGIQIVDSQHKALVDKLNQFFEACMQKKGKDELMSMIRFLENYVVFHFKTEEDIMQRHKFSGYTLHKTMHDEFIKEFLKIKDRFEKEGATLELVNSTTKFLTNWLIEHISKIDKQLSGLK
ncbi:hemerythrin family protein [bacterium]|nr:hemerythrin family protein [bacterium]